MIDFLAKFVLSPLFQVFRFFVHLPGFINIHIFLLHSLPKIFPLLFMRNCSHLIIFMSLSLSQSNPNHHWWIPHKNSIEIDELKQSRINRLLEYKIPPYLLAYRAGNPLTPILILYILHTSLAHHQMRTNLIDHHCPPIITYLTILIRLPWRLTTSLFLLLLWFDSIISFPFWCWAKFTLTFYSLFIELFTYITVVILYLCLAVRTCISSYYVGVNLLEI